MELATPVRDAASMRSILHTFAIASVALLAACSTPATKQPTALRVVSYNIRHGEGMDGRVDLDRTAATLRALQPDLIALQEVDNGVKRSGRVDQAARLGTALGMRASFASFMDYQGGRYGLAVLSRLPIRSERVIPLPPGDEPRAALLLEVEAEDGQSVAIACVHFHWVADDATRYAQAATLCQSLDALAMPWLVVGDYNDTSGSRTLALFEERAKHAAKQEGARFTFPADAPDREIDFVYAAPRERWGVLQSCAIDERVASDHRPVLTVLSLQPRGD
jgi:endonuclease/exonuclease/phosphatase family metal-dependent hydrolase